MGSRVGTKAEQDYNAETTKALSDPLACSAAGTALQSRLSVDGGAGYL